jgi:hypothetical protein
VAAVLESGACPGLRPPLRIAPLGGLGDHIFVAGAVRFLAAYHERIVVISEWHQAASVAALYRDLPGVHVLPPGMGADAPDMAHITVDLVGGRTERLEPVQMRQLGVSWEASWTCFRLDRDWAAEAALLAEIGVSEGEEFVFVHDDVRRGLVIDRRRLPDGLRLVEPGGSRGAVRRFPLPVWLGVLERAAEVHCIESSFAALVDRCPSVCGRLVFHRYARPHGTERMKATRRRLWEVLR